MKQTTFASAAWDKKGKVTRRERSQTKADPDSLAASASVAGSGVRREKAAFSSGWKAHPASAPAGSYRSNCGGNETVEAFGKCMSRLGDSASVQAAT